MSKITDEEINKTIAEFMELGNGIEFDPKFGYLVRYNNDGSFTMIKRAYTVSLDALVPVVERLNKSHTISISFLQGEHEVFTDTLEINNQLVTAKKYYDKSPSRALALACYHAIKEMEA